MKKFLSIFLIIIIFLIIYFLQANVFNGFKIFNVKPNLFIIFAMLIGLFLGREYGFIWGVVLGLILDLFIGRNIGTNSISLGIVGFMAGVLEKNFSNESRFTIMIFTIMLTFLSETVTYVMQIILNSGSINLVEFIKIILIEILYNVIIVIIIYPTFQRLGKYLEGVFYDRNKTIHYY